MKENEKNLNDQTGNNFMDFSEQLVKREKNGMFTVVTVEQGSFIAFNNVILTEMQSEEVCHRMINEKDWELIASFSMMLVSATKTSDLKLRIEEATNGEQN